MGITCPTRFPASLVSENMVRINFIDSPLHRGMVFLSVANTRRVEKKWLRSATHMSLGLARCTHYETPVGRPFALP